jgi:L-lactate dehydrogenase complex protein LldG
VSSREDVLSRVRTAIADGTPAPPIPRAYQRAGAHGPGSDEVVELMIDRLIDYKAEVRQANADSLATEVDAALASAKSVVVAPGLESGVVEACGQRGRAVTTDTEPEVLTAAQLDAIDAVVTTATVGIGLSGTIVLDGGPAQGRRAITLVPDLHVIILRTDQIVETVPEAIGRLEPTRPLTMIAGPSATSDIELNRVEGVHGPRTLIVVILRA